LNNSTNSSSLTSFHLKFSIDILNVIVDHASPHLFSIDDLKDYGLTSIAQVMMI